MNNPLKSQIAANRERFEKESYFRFNNGVTHAQGTTRINEYIYEGEAFNMGEELATSQTSLLQTAIAAVERIEFRPKGSHELIDKYIARKHGFIICQEKVVELLKGGIEE